MAKVFIGNMLATEFDGASKTGASGGTLAAEDPVIFASREIPDPSGRIAALKDAGYVGVFEITAEEPAPAAV